MASGATKTEAKKSPYGLGCNENRGQKGIEFKKKRPIWPRVQWKPRQKGPLWLRFLTEAKSYDLLALPQYASVPEPVQNIKNNCCQRPFLHWWWWLNIRSRRGGRNGFHSLYLNITIKCICTSCNMVSTIWLYNIKIIWYNTQWVRINIEIRISIIVNTNACQLVQLFFPSSSMSAKWGGKFQVKTSTVATRTKI